jgi:nucleoid-associated protein YgaU
MFFEGSRYRRVADAAFSDGLGQPATFKALRERLATETALVYQVREGDRLDLLAWRFYKEPRKWWLIADANPDVLDPADLLVPGRSIVIPRDRNP